MQEIHFPNTATPLGCTAYYVIRFSPARKRNTLAALFLWKGELLDLYSLSDPGVARMKLQWWREQIFLPVDTPSEHSLARTLSQLIEKDPASAETLSAMIRETDRHLHRQPYQDFELFWQGCLAIGGSFAQLINVASTSHAETIDLDIGAYCIATEWLQLMGQHIRYNIHLIPEDLLEQNTLRLEELLYQDNQQRSRPILKRLYEQIENKRNFPAPKRSSNPLYKYYRLRKKMAELLVEEDFNVLDQKISLTPIRKLWFAL